ncbi:hypothetical protein DFH28DRAFT_981199 [Melampsora americana]|nr:hypothetical protein DFH28DRAFT_981199 [Melampsora americana]
MQLQILSLLLLLFSSQLILTDAQVNSFMCAKSCQGVCASPSAYSTGATSVQRQPAGSSSFANLGAKDQTSNQYDCANMNNNLPGVTDPVGLCCGQPTPSEFTSCVQPVSSTDITECG